MGRMRSKQPGIPPEFGPATRAWFERAFAAPTRVQVEGWRHIVAGEHALLTAPTGSGKTLAAFLACIDRLGRSAPVEDGVRVLYVSPLKALAYDVERNLRAPLVGIQATAGELGLPVRPLTVAVRTGDTPERERRLLAREPADLLITTPESLYLLLGSRAGAVLSTVETVIVDETHALAATKRGAHLALSLERLVAMAGREPQRIGLSATQRPLEAMAAWLGGAGRQVAIVDAGERPKLELTIEVPTDQLGEVAGPPSSSRGAASATDGVQGAEGGVWTAIQARLLELIRGHRSTIVFANSRRLCERLAGRLNEIAGEDLVRAHHGSIARAQREEIERELKEGRLRGIVATSSLELGIDMGAVDLVVQVESPGAVARGLQRVGRAGHQVGAASAGRIFPKYRGDLLEAAVVARRMLDGEIEEVRIPKTPLDVLAQQIVAMVASAAGPLAVDEVFRVVRGAQPFVSLSRELYVGMLEMLAGRYPSDAFADLRPRLVWDRARDLLTPRRDAKTLALVNGGTIPNRGLYAVHLGEEGPRIGELDEEMVHELRVGQTFLLGASTWRAVDITRDRVVVAPAPGEPGKMPFWRGEGPGRPVELGRAVGALVGRLGKLLDKKSGGEAEAERLLREEFMLDERAARTLTRYVAEQREATATLPTDTAITVERFRDELGDWRVCILSPFGARVHAPWALALEARLGTRAGYEVQALWSDDGIALRFADTDEVPASSALLFEPDELEELLLAELGGSALFATHFRENAARALLLPRRRPGSRTPLWAQRLKAQALMAAAMRHPSFPIVLETYRECMNDVFDVASLTELMGAIRRREVRVVEAETQRPSPFARSLAFAWVAAYLYEGDAPLAERRAQALTLDRNLLRELLGQAELESLLEPAVLDELEGELQGLAEDFRARHADGLHDLLRRVGDLSLDEIRARVVEPEAAPGWLEELRRGARAIELRVAGEERWVAIEDVARYRDAVGAAPPRGVPLSLLEPVPEALPSLVARWARTHAPFPIGPVAARLGVGEAAVRAAAARLVAEGRLVEGRFRAGAGEQLCDVEILRVLRRRTLAHLRREVSPVEDATFARFLVRWHGIRATRAGDGAEGGGVRGLNRLREALEQLEALPLPFSELERVILPARVPAYQPRLLDELGASGELVWVGRGALGGDDGRVMLVRRDRVATLLEPVVAPAELPPVEAALLAHLTTRGASFFAQLDAVARAAGAARGDDVEAALWSLVWAGLVTNDTFAPLRGLRARGGPRQKAWQVMGGRWSAVEELRRSWPGAPADGAAGDTQRAHARAVLLLERYGIVSREAATLEGIAGGFSSLVPILREMEHVGRVRRGHFVEGLRGAQYAHPGAVDRLRAERSPTTDDGAPPVVVLSAIDPANPWGALLPWPTPEGMDGGDGADDDGAAEDDGVRPRRVAGAEVVLVRGVPIFFVEKGGAKLSFFARLLDEDMLPQAIAALRAVAARRRHHQLRIEQVNGQPALRSPHARALEKSGFRVEPGHLVLEAPAAAR